jgi:hypothetical protein
VTLQIDQFPIASSGAKHDALGRAAARIQRIILAESRAVLGGWRGTRSEKAACGAFSDINCDSAGKSRDFCRLCRLIVVRGESETLLASDLGQQAVDARARLARVTAAKQVGVIQHVIQVVELRAQDMPGG